ncbi:hypothetical protein RCG17_06725 [Neobacillus sp. PS3-12]|uniref:hypothetical protein n=1 Tax=Neobacillus sp. PS3-12 TaxID=3070677 RepID=UPI0027E15350|nr:hypothetical protein [Neobacillus sp. PS3-12]WML54335.1 hypothetical protein RCG17_06725 [Neobacillus sp. PS3-12]
MPEYTKLVNCGNNIYVYDYKSCEPVKQLGLEREVSEEGLLGLKWTLRTNFGNGDDYTLFTMNITDFDSIEHKLDQFVHALKKSSGVMKLVYFAVLELPNKDHKCGYVQLVINIPIYMLTCKLNKKKLDPKYLYENDDEWSNEEAPILIDDLLYLSDIWGNDLDILFPSQSELILLLTSSYLNSLLNPLNSRVDQISFSNSLSEPTILWDHDANEFIHANQLIDYPYHYSEEFYDPKAGFTIMNRYSLSL